MSNSLLLQRHPVIFDTNTYVAAALNPLGTNAAAIHAALISGASIVQSTATRDELREKLLGDNVKPYLTEKLSLEQRKAVMAQVVRTSRLLPAVENFSGSRDVKDNMFVDAAIAARAAYIITGDKDLLVLKCVIGITHPIHIVSPADFIRHDNAMIALEQRRAELADVFAVTTDGSACVTFKAPQPAVNDRVYRLISGNKNHGPGD